MSNYLMLALSLLLATDAIASEWRPSDRLLKAVRTVESADGLHTYGDEGRSLGDFQISEGAWLDVNSRRRARGEKTYDYSLKVHNRQVSKVYAADYLTLIHTELERVYKRPPSVGETYAAYNMGLRSFANCRYQLNRVNPVTAKKCQAIRALMEEPSAPLRVAMVQNTLSSRLSPRNSIE